MSAPEARGARRPERLTAAALVGILRPGSSVFVAGSAGEPLGIAALLARQPSLTHGVRFVGSLLPGINRFDYALDPAATMEGFFPVQPAPGGAGAGRHIVRALHYSEAFTYLRDTCPIDILFVQVAPPDAAGHCSLGVMGEFIPAVLHKAQLIVAEISTAMPRTRGAPVIPYSRIDWALETDRPPLHVAAEQQDAAVSDAIAGHVAGLVRDGDTLQTGLGRVPQLVLSKLGGHRDLGLHSGLISDGVVDLVDSGAMPRSLTAALALGTARLYDFLTQTDQVTLASVEDVHFAAAMAKVRALVAINSALQVDLFGQVNAEMVGARRVSSVGGLVDFMRGAKASPGGRSIVALPATARGGISRIVMQLEPPTVVSAARADADYIVTEFGVAALRFASIEERATALIAVAAPEARPFLDAAWRDYMKDGTS